MLTIQGYAEAERLGVRRLSNDHIRAFSPATFLQHGFPVSAAEISDIVRYADTMQELNAPIRRHEVETYSAREALLVRTVSDCARTVTERLSDRPVRPWMGPLAAMDMLRAVRHVARVHGRERLRVFEIGPGSGYLGALLVAAGHEYISTDNCQGFYLWQSHFMAAVAGADFEEGASSPSWPYSREAGATHMPWWHFAQLHMATWPRVDIIICDHALGELNPYALRYVCQIARLMLADSDIGYFLYSSIGAPQFHSEEAVRLNFDRVGLSRPVHGVVTIFAKPNQVLPSNIKELASAAPSPDDMSGALRGTDFVPINWEEAPLSYRLYQFLGYEVPRSKSD